MRKIITSIAVLALVAVASIGVTRAFFTSTAESNGNTINSGTLDLLLNLDAAGGGWSNSFGASETPGYDDLAPGGDTADLSVRLQNDGSTDAAAIGLAVDHTSNPSNIAAQMRITQLDWQGESLLEGGAGADIPEYVAPTSCDYTVSSNIQTNGIDQAADGEVVCVEAGTYTEDLTINTDNVTLVAVNAPDSGNEATINGRIDVSSNGVTIRGFEITNPSERFGVVLTDVTGGVVDHNVFTDIGTSSGLGDTQAIYLDSSSAEVRNNVVTNIGSLSSANNGSVKGVYIGDTSGSSGTLSGIVVENNEITDIKRSTATWDNGGGGAYGVLINYGGDTGGAVITNNTLSDLEGLWSHAIGLEGDTPNASVTFNDISDIVDHKSPTDAVAVFFEANPSADTVVVNENNLDAPLGVAVHPDFDSFTGTIDATNNWWGGFNPSDHVFENEATIDYTPIAGGPHIGFIDGADQNGNGFADLNDLAQDPIANATPGLDAQDTGQLDFHVQLDGPSTGNGFQGVGLESDFTYTLGQVVN